MQSVNGDRGTAVAGPRSSENGEIVSRCSVVVPFRDVGGRYARGTVASPDFLRTTASSRTSASRSAFAPTVSAGRTMPSQPTANRPASPGRSGMTNPRAFCHRASRRPRPLGIRSRGGRRPPARRVRRSRRRGTAGASSPGASTARPDSAGREWPCPRTSELAVPLPPRVPVPPQPRVRPGPGGRNSPVPRPSRRPDRLSTARDDQDQGRQEPAQADSPGRSGPGRQVTRRHIPVPP